MEEKKVSGLNLASIMTLYFVSMAITIVTPAMATFMEHWPDKAAYISYISTLPTLFIVIGTFIAGSIMGKKIKYRTLAITAGIIALIGGIAPAFFDNFELTLVCRAILGLGAGLLAPLGNALIVGLYKGQKQANLLGYGTLFMNAGGIILQILGGVLAGTGERGWQLVFWGHALLIVAVVMAFFLPEPPAEDVVSNAGKKEPMGKSIYLIALLIFVYNLLAFPEKRRRPCCGSNLSFSLHGGGRCGRIYFRPYFQGGKAVCYFHWNGSLRTGIPACLCRGNHADHDGRPDDRRIWIFHLLPCIYGLDGNGYTAKHRCHGIFADPGLYESGRICGISV